MRETELMVGIAVVLCIGLIGCTGVLIGTYYKRRHTARLERKLQCARDAANRATMLRERRELAERREQHRYGADDLKECRENVTDFYAAEQLHEKHRRKRSRRAAKRRKQQAPRTTRGDRRRARKARNES